MTFEELEAYAEDLGAIIEYGEIPSAAVVQLPTGPPVICLPARAPRQVLEESLAHELGHLVLGHLDLGGYGNEVKPNWVMEIEANHWAQKALEGRGLTPYPPAVTT